MTASRLDAERSGRSARIRRAPRLTGIQAGAVIALVAVVAGAFFAVRPPDAYGICMACHGRDLVNGLSNVLWGTRLTVAPVSAVFPLLTVLGVLGGALAAAWWSSELKLRRARQPLRGFIHGIVIMNLALLAAGCSARLLLRTAAGDWLGLSGFGAMVIGVVLGTYWLRWRAAR